MSSPARERRLHQLFRLGVLIKGADGILECAAGAALLVVGTEAAVAWIDAAAHGSLHHLLAMVGHSVVNAKSFYPAYLLGHGVIKVVLVAGLLNGSSWSYPFALTALAGFIVYQAYRIVLTPSLGLVGLTLFDGIVLLLIWHEWRISRSAMGNPPHRSQKH